eukprot:COSAG06_NODE_4715_length_4014_cov_42.572158_4_plen_31_part_00
MIRYKSLLNHEQTKAECAAIKAETAAIKAE